MYSGDIGRFCPKRKSNIQQVTEWISWAILLICILLAVYLYRIGALRSSEELQAVVDNTGAAGMAIFFAVQIVQVVIPIIPGGVSCLAGVLLFGAWKGFLLNYTGICLGSMIAFGISRNLGKELLTKIFPEKLITKYTKWTEQKSRFTKLFALAIFFPVAPDDFLCYLAGTTGMKWGHFTLIIWLGKPLSIAAYSLGLQIIFQHIIAAL